MSNQIFLFKKTEILFFAKLNIIHEHESFLGQNCPLGIHGKAFEVKLRQHGF